MTTGGRIEAIVTVPSGVTLSATNSGGGPTTVTITPGNYAPTGLVAQVVTDLNAQRTGGTWSGSISTGSSGTGKVTLNCTGTPWSITWIDGTLQDMMGFTASIAGVSTAQTGSQQARGLWMPDVPLLLDGDPKRAPLGSDRRSTVSPTGASYTLVGSTYYRHRNLRYNYVARNRVWTAEETTTNQSWETFYKETQLGISGSGTWYTPGSAVYIYFDNAGTDTLVGADLGGNSWKLVKPQGLDELALSKDQFAGLVNIVLGDIYSDGT